MKYCVDKVKPQSMKYCVDLRKHQLLNTEDSNLVWVNGINPFIHKF